MLRISNTLKCAALAGAFGLAAIVGGATAASARSCTRCDGDHCWRVNCDWNGDNCYREGSYYRDYYHRYGYNRGYYGGYYNGYGHRRWFCDRDGDDCHWVRY